MQILDENAPYSDRSAVAIFVNDTLKICLIQLIVCPNIYDTFITLLQTSYYQIVLLF